MPSLETQGRGPLDSSAFDLFVWQCSHGTARQSALKLCRKRTGYRQTAIAALVAPFVEAPHECWSAG